MGAEAEQIYPTFSVVNGHEADAVPPNTTFDEGPLISLVNTNKLSISCVNNVLRLHLTLWLARILTVRAVVATPAANNTGVQEEETDIVEAVTQGPHRIPANVVADNTSLLHRVQLRTSAVGQPSPATEYHLGVC
ncbi:hypothetical protein BaRGS_00024908 [Batillaria attramentaria]|uniref:Uncharacterized protein n=1 Tax=Batillaria attramentaria TaxID=370345 RepID=A0ABD0K9Q9_9CAEN